MQASTTIGRSITPVTVQADALQDLFSGLRVRAVEGVVRLDRPAPVRHLATATLRGLVGHLLCESDAALVGRWFKPGHDNNQPAAFLFQPLHRHAATDTGFPFRLVTWDPPGEMLPALCRALARAGGWPFGGSGATVAGIDMDGENVLEFEGCGSMDHATLELRTPHLLKHRGGWVQAEALTVGHLAEAMVRRLNRLSSFYGNGAQLEEMEYEAQAAMVYHASSDLTWVAPRRWSSTHGDGVTLSGIVGTAQVENLPANLASLLSAGEILHMGKHTTEGCGWLQIGAC